MASSTIMVLTIFLSSISLLLLCSSPSLMVHASYTPPTSKQFEMYVRGTLTAQQLTNPSGKILTAYGSMVNYDGPIWALFDVLIMGQQSFIFATEPSVGGTKYGRSVIGDCDPTVSVCTAGVKGQSIQLFGHCVRYDIFFNPDALQYWIRRSPGLANAGDMCPNQDDLAPLQGMKTWQVPSNSSAYGIAVSPDSRHVYVTGFSNGANSSIAVYRRTNTWTGVVEWVQTITHNGNDIWLDGASGVAVSADGNSVYVAAYNSYAIQIFTRNITSGVLTPYANVQTNDNNPRLEGVRGVTVSWDGKNVYFACELAQVMVTFTRDSSTGALYNPITTPTTTDARLLGARASWPSKDGRNLYVAAFYSDSLVTFDRDNTTGYLSNPRSIQKGVAGVNPMLTGASDVRVSPDGKNVYAVSFFGNAIITWDRAANGTLYNARSFNGDGNSSYSMYNVFGLGMAIDGRWVFVTSQAPGAIIAFSRNATTGNLSVRQVVTDTADIALDGARRAMVSPDDMSVYVASYDANTIGSFDLNLCDLYYCDLLTKCYQPVDQGPVCSACPYGYSGIGETNCVDIDECAVANGGCHPDTDCINTPGSYLCRPQVQIATVGIRLPAIDNETGVPYEYTATYPAPFVLPSTAGGPVIEFLATGNISNITVKYGEAWYYPYPSDNHNFMPCENVTYAYNASTLLTTLRCTTTPGIGTQLVVSLWHTRWVASQYIDYLIPSSFDNDDAANWFSYNKSIIFGATLHAADYPSFYAFMGGPPSTDLHLTSFIAGTRIAFNGVNFLPIGYSLGAVPKLYVQYGPPHAPKKYTCTLSDDTTFSEIRCTTAQLDPLDDGAYMQFTLFWDNKSDGPFSVQSPDFLHYPLPAIVRAIAGCAGQNGIQTTDCNTEGGDIITICGTSFWDAVDVWIDSQACTDTSSSATYWDSSLIPGNFRYPSTLNCTSLITCRTPVGAGTDRSVSVRVQPTQSLAPTVFMLSYAAPNITEVYGCNQTFADGFNLAGCSRYGGDLITLVGRNFGSNTTRVFIAIGTRDVECIVQVPYTNNTHQMIICALPAGTGVGHRLTVQQRNAQSSVSPFTISYQQCYPGMYLNGLDCGACGVGTYSPALDSTTCTSCDSGYYSNDIGHTYCDICLPGTYSTKNASLWINGFVQGPINCSACAPGSYAITYGLPACVLCPLGKYGNISGLAECVDCGNGTYSGHIGQTLCDTCPPGHIASSAGHSACEACPAGSVSPDGLICVACDTGTYSDGATCVPCAAGMQQPSMGQTTCIECSLGTAGASRGLAVCPSCAPGYFQDNTGATGCHSCAIGTEAQTWGHTVCDFCTLGRYSTGGQAFCDPCTPSTYAVVGQSTCNQCNAGTYAAAWNQSSCDTCTSGSVTYDAMTCTTCGTGYYANAIGNACVACSAGTQQPSSSSTSCLTCPMGSYSNDTAFEECLSCIAGSYQPLSGATACVACGAGTFQAYSGQYTCLLCWPGTYANVSGLPVCYGCDAGFYQPNSNAMACEACNPGTYAADGYAWSCRQCPAGSYASSIAATACITCSAGTYAKIGSSSCLPCASGTRSMDGASSCTSCSVGSVTPDGINCVQCNSSTFAHASGVLCQSCAPTMYQPMNAATTCLQCQPGYTTDGYSCTACSKGFYSITADPGCTPCAAGKYQGSNNATTCLECGGYPSTGYSACVMCQVGQYPDTVARVCSDCPAGRYNDRTWGGYQCRSCPIGSYSAATGSSNCTTCAAGKYRARVGGESCDDCPAGTKGPTTGLTVCAACLVTRYSPGGTSSCWDCPARSTRHVSGTFCVCENGFCPTYNLNQTSHLDSCDPCTQDGWWGFIGAVNVTDDVAGKLWACAPGYCPAAQTCGANRKPYASNPLCGSCLDNYYEWDGQCIECTTTKQGGFVFLYLMFVWVFVVILHWVTQFATGVMKIFFFFTQSALFMLVPVPKSLTWVRLFNFFPAEASGATCFATLSPYQKMLFEAYQPFIFMSLLLGTAIAELILRRVLARFAGPFVWKKYARTLLSLVILSYTQVGTVVAEYVSCTSVGPYSLNFFHAEVNCNNSSYKGNRDTLIPLMLLHLVVFPALMLWQLCHHQTPITAAQEQFGDDSEDPMGNRARRDGMKLISIWGPVFECYRAPCYWWEVVALVRRGLMIAIGINIPYNSNNFYAPWKYTAFVLFLLSLIAAHVIFRPFLIPWHNTLEAISLLVLLVLAVVLTGDPNAHVEGSAGEVIVNFLVAVPILVFIILTILRLLSQAFSIIRHRRRAEQDAGDHDEPHIPPPSRRSGLGQVHHDDDDDEEETYRQQQQQQQSQQTTAAAGLDEAAQPSSLASGQQQRSASDIGVELQAPPAVFNSTDDVRTSVASPERKESSAGAAAATGDDDNDVSESGTDSSSATLAPAATPAITTTPVPADFFASSVLPPASPVPKSMGAAGSAQSSAAPLDLSLFAASPSPAPSSSNSNTTGGTSSSSAIAGVASPAPSATLLDLLTDEPIATPAVHPSAVVAPSAITTASSTIGGGGSAASVSAAAAVADPFAPIPVIDAAAASGGTLVDGSEQSDDLL